MSNLSSMVEVVSHEERRNKRVNLMNGSEDNKRRKRMTKITREMRAVAYTILAQYNSLVPFQLSGKKLGEEENAAAHEAFVSKTGHQINIMQWNKITHDLRKKEAQKISLPSPTVPKSVMQDVSYDNEDADKEDVKSEERKLDYRELSKTLEDLNLQVVTIDDWILIQRCTFDVHIEEEPYHSIQIYANLKSLKFIRRVWGISERSGEVRTAEDVRDLCIATFYKSAVCLGHTGPIQDRDLNLLQVKYPFTRWISKSCGIRYSKDENDECIGICSACNSAATNVKKMGNSGQLEEPAESLVEEDLIGKREEDPEDIKNEKDDEDNWSNHEEDFKDNEENVEGDLIHAREEVEEDVISESDEEDNCSNHGRDPEDIKSEKGGGDNWSTHKEEDLLHGREEVEEDVENDNDEDDNCSDHEEILKGTEKNNGQTENVKRHRMTKITKEMREVAKSILAEYNCLKPLKKGGYRMSYQDNVNAHQAFVATTRHQISREQWNKIASTTRLKCEKDSMKLLSKSDPFPFLCAECPQKFPLASNLVKHIRKHHKEDKSTVQESTLPTCDKCGLPFSSKGSLKLHVKTKHESYSEREYKCDFPDCNVACVSVHNLNAHKLKHGERNFVCDHCAARFWNNNGLTHHLRYTHKALPELKLKCRHCEEIFDNYSERMYHTNIVHFPDKHKCNTCLKSFATNFLVKKHIKSAHNNGTFVKCQECGKQLSNEDGLKVHMRKHTGKFFSCSYCPWKSHVKSKFYHHMRLQHKNEWLREEEENKDILKCPECGKNFVNKIGLTLHKVKVHGLENKTCRA